VEEVLYENHQVQEVAVAGGVGANGRAEIRAYVVSRAGAAPESEELITFCQRRLAAHAVPTRIEFCQELPRSATGKVIRALLEQIGRES